MPQSPKNIRCRCLRDCRRRRAWINVRPMKKSLVLLPLLGLAAGCTSVSTNYTGAITQADPSRIIVCHGHDCVNKERVDMTAADSERFAAIMASGSASPEAERRAVSAAVQYFEERASQVIGIRDKGKSQIGPMMQHGNMDCIDESTNTRSLLLYLAERNLLKHHTVEPNRSRGFLVDGKFPHATAVLRDTSTGVEWAIDSWEKDAGLPPEIITLEKWVGNGGIGEVIGGRST